MKKSGRLERRADFLRVQDANTKWISKSLVLQIAPSSIGSDTLRFGLTASKKVSESAVIRNRARRRLRSAAYDVLPAKAKPGFDYVLVARPDTVNKTYEEICRDLTWCLEKLGCAL